MKFTQTRKLVYHTEYPCKRYSLHHLKFFESICFELSRTETPTSTRSTLESGRWVAFDRITDFDPFIWCYLNVLAHDQI